MSKGRIATRAARYLAAFAALLVVTSSPSLSDPAPVFSQVVGEATLQPQPPQPPSSLEGAAIFSQRCAPCHGEQGKGDGPMAQQASLTVPDLTDPNWVRAVKPGTWYDIITKGSVETGGAMPPFGESSSRPLSEQERWNVLFYAWSLSTTPERIEQGRLIYSQRCSTCHGEDGRGKGPGVADQTLPDFTDSAFMAGRTQTDLFNAIGNGQGAGQAMPAFANVLSEEERWALADYVRTFSYIYAPPSQLSTATPPEARRYTVVGQVTNATTGATVPAGTPVTLHIYDAVSELATFTTTVGTDGSYRFSDVLIPHGAISEVEARQDYAPFYTPPFTYPLTTDVLTVPVQIYDLTSDPSVIRLDQWHIAVSEVAESTAEVFEIFVYSNTSDRAFAPPPQGAEGLRTVRFPLPREAREVSIVEGGTETTITRTDEGLAYTLPVPPGQHTITVAYRLPLNGPLTSTRTAPYPVGSMVVLAPKDSLRLSSPQFTSQDEQEFSGEVYTVYRGSPLAAGSTFSLTLAPPQTLPVGLIVGGTALAVALIGVGVWWWRRSAAGPAEQPVKGQATARIARIEHEARREALLQQIADLDDAYENGQMDQAAYEKKRAALKRELVALMKEE